MRINAESESFSVKVNSPAAQIYRGFTKGVGLQEWLCNGARSFPRIGGMLTMWWNSGYYMVGEFTRLEPNSTVSFTWQGRNEPHVSQVQVSFIEEDGATLVEVTHAGLGSEEIWVEPRKELKKGWDRGLENLKSVFETGKDIRVVNRPGMGIYPAEVSIEAKAEYGFPVEKGILLTQVIEGRGAEKAGLQKGDLVTEINGTPIENIEALIQFLSRQNLGDHIDVTFYRGGEKKMVEVELMTLPGPQVPDNHAEFVSKLEVIFDAGYKKLMEAVANISDEAASWKPAPTEWSVKETLAHIIHTERDNQSWLHAKVLDEDYEWLNNSIERGIATILAYSTVQELMDEVARSQKETIAFVKNVPDSLLSRKTTFWHLAQGILTADEHIKEHLDQIQQNLNAFSSKQMG